MPTCYAIVLKDSLFSALDKLGFRHVFGQTPVEPVQANVAFDIASLVLYGCQALPIRLKILLDRLFSVLQRDEVLQILRGFGWTHEDYARGYILQEPHGPVLDRWNICSPEEEPLVLQQFLRFGETRAITQQLLLHGLSDMRQFPRMEADIKKLIEKASRNNNNNNVSPLNKLQNMQPFDFRKLAISSSKQSPERRRHSDTRSPPSLNLSVTSPSPSMILPPPPPPPLERPPQKSPSVDLQSFGGSSEFDSEEDYDNEENSQSALNLSKDCAAKAMRQTRERSGPGRKSMKRHWGANLPPNLGIQLINPATGKKRVQCNVCLKTFCDKGALKIHYSAVHLREMHKCTVDGCNMMFSSRRSRNRHSANPNPKLHSPHLRRKISPHDGRSSQAHPILIPPLQGGLNPLSFGGFPLLTPPPDMMHHAQSMDLSLKYQQYHDDHKMMENSSDDFNMDDDDEEGIVIDGGEDYDDKYFPENGEKSEDMKIKSDSEEEGLDSNDDSISLADSQGVKEDKVQNMSSNKSRKRKSLNPTRISSKQLCDENRMKESDDEEEEEDLKEQNEDGENRSDSVSGETVKKIKLEDETDDKKESNNNEHFEGNENGGNDKDNINKESAETMNALKHLEHLSNSTSEKFKKYVVPETSDHSDGSDDSDDPENKIYGHFENGSTFLSSTEIPIDTDNPLRCLSCNETFESHFVLKTHYQNEHLKLMHKCVIKGCNAAFHSKRSRDRHSSNSNLHRKLLSTNVANEGSVNNNGIINPLFLENLQLQQQNLSQIQNLAQLQQGGPNNPLFHNEFLTRLYAEQLSNFSNGHLNLFQQHQAAGFPGFPLPNGLNSRQSSRGRESRSSRESSSPSSTHPVYNVEEDLCSTTEFPIQCRFCAQSISSRNDAKIHFEQFHLSEMFKCHNSNCSLVFSSRTKRNLHQEQEKQFRNSSTSLS
ncbi:zinc finger protein basonuclin-2 [Diaphorina citri]|uniref:Zinc finger protein basonuclin-2 n=1 Tax=Diaphorina citri TaxID=121845 RepID=A0A3Q0J2J0_DIACI|nr:zinc finger protein basonuclin-2 [Diaphorina citri]